MTNVIFRGGERDTSGFINTIHANLIESSTVTVAVTISYCKYERFAAASIGSSKNVTVLGSTWDSTTCSIQIGLTIVDVDVEEHISPFILYEVLEAYLIWPKVTLPVRYIESVR